MASYKNKKVVIMGLGQYPHGSGIEAAKFFIKQGAKVIITDIKTKKQLARQIKQIARGKWQMVLGKHRKQDFKNTDLIVQNPGVPDNSPYLKIARQNKIPITNDIAVFFQSIPKKQLVVGVTGTRGKSTTTALIHKIIKQKFPRARLAGNIGNSPLAFAEKLKKDEPVVLELSSWLLHHLGNLKISPQVAIVTNVLKDHLNRYETFSHYVKDKEQIFKYQKKNGSVILNYDNPVTRRMAKKTRSRIFWFSLSGLKQNGACLNGDKIIFKKNNRREEVVKKSALCLEGEHNLANTLAAVAAAKVLKIPNYKIKKALKVFRGLPYRLEKIKIKNGVSYYNDSTSTTPDALIAALKTLGRNIILIAGGNSKGLPIKPAHKIIKQTVKHLILTPGTATSEFPRGKKVKDLKSAVRLARKLAKSGDSILFSPATTWLPKMNEFERGEEFNRIIKRN